MVGRQATDHSRLDVEATGQVAVVQALPADQHLAVAARLAHRLLMAIDSSLIDDRAEPVLADHRIADHDRLRLLDQQADELVVDRSLDVDP